MSIYKRGNVWWVYLKLNGDKIRQSTGTENEKQAQDIHDELKVNLRKQKQLGKTTDDALSLWLNAKERNNKEICALRIFREAYPSRPLSQVNGYDILDALADKSASNYNRIISNVSAAIKMALNRGWCNPIHIPKRKVESKRLRFLSHDEWERLQTELPTHLLPMARFAIATGLRQSNVFNLRWDNVDVRRKVAWVDSTESKSKKAISIPLSDYACGVLTAQKGLNGVHVFTYKDKPLKSLKNAWSKALVRAEIKDFRWHDLRHTWASWHIQNGTPLAVLKELGGWHSMDMVLRYAHLSPDHLKEYANNSIASVS